MSTRTTDRRVSDERLNELIEWYVDDCNAYTEQHDADIRSLLGELAARRLADETPECPHELCGECGHEKGVHHPTHGCDHCQCMQAFTSTGATP
jgi:hypothetical protein